MHTTWELIKILEHLGEVTTAMNMAPNVNTICSIYYMEKPYKVIVIRRELRPFKDGYWVTVRLATDEEIKENGR